MTEELIGVGDLVLGKYRVERVLGKGGMGLVVAARHVELGELFAIKLLLPHALEHAEAVERFLREARTSARLKGDHIAKVHDVGRMEGGTPYMIMEHLVGTDLQGLLKGREGPLPIDDVLTYIVQACEAVAEAHSLGVVHRDLKPANMFLIHLPNGEPCVKVLDFGISKQIGPGDGWSGDLTQTGTLLGSPLYMSPEQMQAKAVDVRSDVWAIGAVLFELLTGRPPYVASIFSELIAKVVLEAPPSPAQLRGDVPPDLERIVLKCLEKRPDDRFQTVPELMLHLRSVGAPREPLRESVTRADGPFASVPPAPRAPLIALPPETSVRAQSVAPASLPPAPVSAAPPSPSIQLSGASSNIVTAASVSRAVAPASGSRVRFVTVALVAAAAIGGTVLFMNGRAQHVQASPIAPASASSVGASAAGTAPSATASVAAKSPRPKNWWDDLPDGSTDAKTTKLPTPRLKWLRLYNRATALERAQKPDEAQVALREALDVARKQLTPEDPAYRETLYVLARLAAKTGKLEDAEKLLREAIQVEAKYGDPTAEGFDEPRQALVAVLVKQGKEEEAKQFWKDSDPPLPLPPPTTSASAPPPPPTPTTSAPPPVKTAPAPVKVARPPDPFAPWATYNKEKK